MNDRKDIKRKIRMMSSFPFFITMENKNGKYVFI